MADGSPESPEPVASDAAAAEPVAEAEAVASPPVEADATAAEAVAEQPAATTEETPAVEEQSAEEAKPVEAAAEETAEAEVAEDAEAAEEAPKRIYEDFTLPEGVRFVDEQLSTFTDLAATHNLDQPSAQAFLDLHVNAMREYDAATLQRQTDAFTSMQNEWRGQFDERAGNRRNTILEDAKHAVADTLKNAEERKAFWGALAMTGAGNHPDVVFGLSKIGKRLREGAAPPKGLPARTDAGMSKADRRYGPRH